MSDSLRARTEKLRREALDALRENEAFCAFRALDDAVAAMGGRRLLADVGVYIGGVHIFADGRSRPLADESTRRVRASLSQGDAAVAVLTEAGRAMTVNELLLKVEARGVNVGGTKPLINFGSTLSRDDRFVSVRREGYYLWWLAAKPWPKSKEEEMADLLDDTSSSDSTSQEGGDADATTTT